MSCDRITYSEEQIQSMMKQIDDMGQIEMARRWRFSKPGDPFFRSDLPLFEKFNKRFQSLGGMSSKISKAIGWKDVMGGR